VASPPPSVAQAVHGKCSQPFASCTETKCCYGAYGCYKREGKAFAMCKKLPEGGAAACPRQPTAGWVCPGAWDELSSADEATAASGGDGAMAGLALVLLLGGVGALLYAFRGRVAEALPEPLRRLVSGEGAGASETEMGEMEAAAEEMEAASAKAPAKKTKAKGKRSEKQFLQLEEDDDEAADGDHAPGTNKGSAGAAKKKTKAAKAAKAASSTNGSHAPSLSLDL